MKKKKQDAPLAASACQLRGGHNHPFGALRGFVPLGTGEERVYRELREAIPVLDAAVGKLVRLSGGFDVRCKNAVAQKKLEYFLSNVPCGHGQMGIDSFLGGYVDSLLTNGRAVGEMVVSGGKLCGMLTDRDIVTRCLASNRIPSNTTVKQVMTGQVTSVSPDMHTGVAAHLMGRLQVRRLPVVENVKLCGMVSLGDFAIREETIMDASDVLGDVSNNLSHR